MIIDIDLDNIELSIIPQTDFESSFMNHLGWRDLEVKSERNIAGANIVKIKVTPCCKKRLEQDG
jgi:hypothetical protein